MLHEVLQLPSNMLRVPQPVGTIVPSVPTMGYGFADPRDLRQRSSDLCLGSDMGFGNIFGRGGLEESQKFPTFHFNILYDGKKVKLMLTVTFQ